jgi:2-succinyl-5-enolpyruvyl-6-hydroxy-3-cyclohexene-1-carboxylate synthase
MGGNGKQDFELYQAFFAPVKLSEENINMFWCSLIVEELVRNGVDYFCISPGSRSAPLTVAAARHSAARTIVCYDERGAAFHALGYAKACGRPAALICTSGTAAANFFPAVVEAYMDYVPLIVLTADRPPELQDTAANQTIFQSPLYSHYTRWFINLPCPDGSISPRMVLTTVDQAVYKAKSNPAGPVHINCMFREPLVPSPAPLPSNHLRDIRRWQKMDSPYTCYAEKTSRTGWSTGDRLRAAFQKTTRPMLAVGRLRRQEDVKAVKSLAEKLQWPVYADVTSGLRLGNKSKYLVPHFDLLLLSERLMSKQRPDVILQIGGRMTSKRYGRLIAQSQPLQYLLVDHHPDRMDPEHKVTLRIESDIAEFCEWLEKQELPACDAEWRNSLMKENDIVASLVADAVSGLKHLDEIAIVRTIAASIPSGNGLFLGNSLPIRLMDSFADSEGALVSVGINRGVSGIDGNVATAAGFAVGLESPVTAVLGDLAVLHDLNSFDLLKKIRFPLHIVVINNFGGGIFHLLPISEYKDVFETFFATPHDYHFEATAKMFDVVYFKPNSLDEFAQAYSESLSSSSSSLIEVQTDREKCAQALSKLHGKIIGRLEG